MTPQKRAHALLPMPVMLAVFVAGSIIHVAELPWWAAGGTALFTLVLFVANCAGAAYAEPYRGLMLVAGVVSAVWLAWCWVDQVWQGTLLAVTLSAPPLVALAATGPWQQVSRTQRAWTQRRDDLRAAGVDPDETPQDPQKRRWETTFAAAGLDGLKYVEREEHACGFALRCTSSKITFTVLAARLEALETVTRIDGQAIPAGCVTVEPVRNDDGRPLAGEYLLLFDIRDVLKTVVQMPDEHGPLSILEAFPVGRYADGSTIYLSLREVQTMVAGLTGSGKTMFLHVVIHQISRCRDAVIWGGDFKGGALIKLWALAWLRGLAKWPMLDWMVVDQWGLERMLRAAVAVIDGRAAKRTGSRWKISPSSPAIILILDELADAVGPTRAPRSIMEGRGLTGAQMAALLTTIVSKGRSEGVWAICAGQRNTVGMFGSGDLMSQMGQRIAFAGLETQMVGSMFQNEPAAARMARNLVHVGTMVIWRALGKMLSIAKKGRVYFMGDDADLDQAVINASIAHQDYMPPLDMFTETLVNPYGYADRFTPEEIYWLVGGQPPPRPAPPTGPPQPARQPAAATAAMTRPQTAAASGGQGFWQGPPPRVQPAPDNQPPSGPDPEFEKVTAGVHPQFVPGRPQPSTVNRYDYSRDKQLLLDIIDDAGRKGISNTEIQRRMRAQGARANPTAVNAWLQNYLSVGKLAQPGGARTLWFTPRHVTGESEGGVGPSEIPPAA